MIKTTRKHVLIALFYFIIAAFLGIFLRLFSVININANYKFLVHTHSHIALLGWVYLGLTTLIFHLFINDIAKKKYFKLFLVTQIAILGMLFSFPFTGYALFSIIFSTLFLFCSYWFYVFFKKHTIFKKNKYSYKFINASLILMIISSIGPWILGIIMNTLGNTSHWYKNAIYFYLHFQYNGWFVFCLFGLFFFFLEKHKIDIAKEFISSFYKYMMISCCLTLFLSFLWIKPHKTIYFLSILGAVFQMVAIGKLQLIFTNYKAQITKVFTPFNFKLLKFVYSLFVTKIILQFLTAIPYFSELISQIIDFVIGYLHLTFLGIVSLTLFVFLNKATLLRLSKIGTTIYLLGFIISEILIFYKGICVWLQLPLIPNYFFILVIVSSLMFIGISTIFIQSLKHSFPKISSF